MILIYFNESLILNIAFRISNDETKTLRKKNNYNKYPGHNSQKKNYEKKNICMTFNFDTQS